MLVVPLTEIAPADVTEARSTCAAFVTVRLSSFVVPPTAPVSVTSPPSASSVSDCEPAVSASIVELKLMSPSDVSLSASLSTSRRRQVHRAGERDVAVVALVSVRR